MGLNLGIIKLFGVHSLYYYVFRQCFNAITESDVPDVTISARNEGLNSVQDCQTPAKQLATSLTGNVI